MGAGTGLMFPHYTEAAGVVAIDPDAAMLRGAQRRAQAARVPVHLVTARAEALPFPNASFDTVLAALTFCTVEHPLRAMEECRRVLKPQGELRLLEHVRSSRPWLAQLQERFTPTWSKMAGGCHLDRKTAAVVEAAGFRIERRQARLAGVLITLSARPSA